MATPEPNHWVDITGTFDAKIAALRAHKSQTAHMDDLDTRIRGWGSANAVAAGLPEDHVAEAYRVISTA
jgi:LmbE family N-acetylglucosaminyl deacetylase